MTTGDGMRAATRILVFTAVMGSGLPLHALQGGSAAQVPAPAPREAAAQPALISEQPAEETRAKLRQVLDQYPPSLVEVLKRDPSLLSNADYLAPYPALAAYLRQHPEVLRNPGFFVGDVHGYDRPRDARAEAVGLWRDLVQVVAVLSGFGVAIGVLAWLTRMLVDYRRWLRLSRIQTEVHTKLLDRLTANDDLMAYMQTPAGRRFLEAAPIPVEAAPRALGAPLGRILFSIQAGVVLAFGGFGLLYVSGRVIEEVAPGVFALGVLAIAFGAGFVVSAGVAYLLSQRLGLLEPAPRVTPDLP